MDISLIIPVLNEAGNLKIFFREVKETLDSLGKTYEIIFVNDGSDDESALFLNEFAAQDACVTVIHFDKNYGMTSVLDVGIRQATGKIILTIDADLQYRTADLLRVVQELQDNDVVLGYRINRSEVDGFIKALSSQIANYVRNMVLRESFHDVGCFLRGFKRECLKELVLYQGFQVFVPSLMNMAGFRIKEIPVQVSARRFGRSKFNIRNRLWKEFLALLVVAWCKRKRLAYKIRSIK
jgi:glycosyltransferase involved in cell wall biosynthesis